jgi:1,4-dihydroxy-6-naphthoate synthase
MGDGYGPRLVSTKPAPPDVRSALRGHRVAVPGLLTTAYLALQLYQPDCTTVVVPFDEIEDAVDRGEVDVIAHPRRAAHLR